MTYRNIIVWLVVGLVTIFSFDYFVLADSVREKTPITDLDFIKATDRERLKAMPKIFPDPRSTLSAKLEVLDAKFTALNQKAAALVAQRAIAAGPQLQIVPKEGSEVVIIIRISDQKAIIEWREEPMDDSQEKRS